MSKKQPSQLRLGIILILIAAAFSSLGQLAWKIGADTTDGRAWLLYGVGFILSGAGMFVMMIAFRYGQVSILQPMMSVGFALSIILGAAFLNEGITFYKVIGTGFIIAGTVVLGIEGNEKKL